MIPLDDMNGDGISEYAVLGQKSSTGEIAAQVRSGGDGAFIRYVFFLNSAWGPLQLLALPDFAGAGSPELGLLATNPAGQIVVMVKDASTNEFIKNVFYLNSNWTPTGALAIANYAGSVSSEIGVNASNTISGQKVLMIKDSETNGFIGNVFPLSANWDVVSGVMMPDETGNGVQEYAALGSAKTTGKILIQVRDAADGSFVRNVTTLGSAWTAHDVVFYGSESEKSLVTVAARKSDGLAVAQSVDAASSAIRYNVFLRVPGTQ